MVVVQFVPFSSTVSPAFWHALIKLKIDVLKLNQEALPLTATYTVGKTFKDRETGADVSLGCNIIVSEDGLPDALPEGQSLQAPPASAVAKGVFKNFNTIEEFKTVDKQALFNDLAEEIWASLTKPGVDPTVALTRFTLITFADLKKYKFYYWFAFPAFASKPAWEIEENGWAPAAQSIPSSGLGSIYESISSGDSAHRALPAYFLVRPTSSSTYETAPIHEYLEFFVNTPKAQRIIGFLDPSSQPQSPGWPLRNLLAYIAHLERSNGDTTTLSVNALCWRDSEVPRAGQEWKSRIGVVSQGASEGVVPLTRPAAVGWERNTAGKLAPRMADLAPMMDPSRLAEQAVDLNLKLMRWRILPGLNLERVSETRCLLLGAGTLGCFVARALMAWGVRTITLVDSGRVSFSNPVRQPLFEYEDCLDGGKPKAQAAAAALKRIFPSVNATGHTLSIPMPGHPIPSSPASLVEQARADVAKLEALIDEHDVVFLLMDSRESRWLPTLLGKSKDKIVINAALGFDSFLVMRHGSGTPPANSPKLGCYYCNDVVAPADSLTDRTLDQMCTVTRPGLASIASSSAVELLVSLLQHPFGNHAPAPPTGTTNGNSDNKDHESVLGVVPHQLRGFLAQFNNVLITGAAYDRCTACSETILEAYKREGFPMLLEAFNDPLYLERLTGLDKMREETDALLEGGDVEWDSEEEPDI